MMRRRPINKYKAAKKFRRGSMRTKSANMRGNPMRGGWRL